MGSSSGKIFNAVYRLAWHLATPVIRKNPRMNQGWAERTLSDNPDGPFDLWIQSASSGESQLTSLVLAELSKHLSPGKRLKILATSGTEQGVERLLDGISTLPAYAGPEVTVRYFPLDAPGIMDIAFSRFNPRLAIVVETELWPGFLIAARKYRATVLVINGRMSEKSFRIYKYFSRLFSRFGPDHICAVSREDADRFKRVTGAENIKVISNMKFDRMAVPLPSATGGAVANMIGRDAPFVIFGSVRKEEEPQILQAVRKLIRLRPDIVIGLFPKHLERTGQWCTQLKQASIPFLLRTELTAPVQRGTIIVWDKFGELFDTYGLADAAFVGGSLAKLGGQNFLEPLAFGIRPVIGPHWKNFKWIGKEITASGLVREVDDADQLVETIATDLSFAPQKSEIRRQVEQYFSSRQGGTRLIAEEILTTLSDKPEPQLV